MNIFQMNKLLDKLNIMLDHAIAGETMQSNFDETKISVLESKLNQYLAQTQTSTKQLAEEKAKINGLIADISHQTKTPIANILLYSQLLSESNLPQEAATCAQALLAQAEKLDFLINTLVKASRLEIGIITVKPSLQPIQPMLEAIKQQVSGLKATQNLKITWPKTPLKAKFDLKWTIEALYNLLDNAIKYTPPEGSITISVINYELFCRIDVTDTGLGIAEAEFAQIFSRFYRSPAVSDYKGVGLGLYLARQIITEQGGYIKAKSIPGQGSTFSVFLPLE